MASKKRANGLGSKPKQHKDGRFYSNYTVYVRGPKGKVPKTKTVYGKTPTECERNLIRALADRDDSVLLDSHNPQLADYLPWWLEKVVADTVKQTTWDGYARMAGRHLAPMLGHVRLKDLDQDHVLDLKSEMLASGLSNRTVRYAMQGNKVVDSPKMWYNTGMERPANQPKTLLEAIRYFADLDVATEFVASLRWPDGPACPKCGLVDPKHYYLKTRRLWKCRSCKKQFSVKVGTIFEDSPLGLDKWLPAVWLIANCKNGISSYELAKDLGVQQKSAWFMLHRIRLAMQTGTFEKLSGQVEADETFIGGKARNMHKSKREQKIQGRGASGKIAVMGLLERHGEVRTKVVPDTKSRTLQVEVRENVEPGSEVHTDALASYRGLDPEYVHNVVDHAETYVRGHVHTNGLENFWSLLKRGIKGTYVSVEPFHLFRYLDEQAFRFNERDGKDADRFAKALGSVSGRRLTYSELIGNTTTD